MPTNPRRPSDESLNRLVQGSTRDTRTIYKLARSGEIPAMRVGREWRFARRNVIEWVANGSEADKLKSALGKARVRRGKS